MLTLTEMMGITTHGLARVSAYAERVRAGGVNPNADPRITAPAPSLRLVDGQNGLGAAVAFRAIQAATEAARDVGMGAAFCRASSHLGALAPYLYLAAEEGFAAIATSNSAPMITPSGGRTATIGNTPLGIAIPNPGGVPVILDMALSVVARSRVREAAAAGQPIPENWATDAEGRPTTDAIQAMGGLMQAIGGSKGANLALCLDLLAGGLSGAAILTEIPNANVTPEAVADIGHMFIVIDAARLMPLGVLSDRLQDARGMVERGDTVDPAQTLRLPGARAIAALETARAHGLCLAPELIDELERLATA